MIFWYIHRGVKSTHSRGSYFLVLTLGAPPGTSHLRPTYFSSHAYKTCVSDSLYIYYIQMIGPVLWRWVKFGSTWGARDVSHTYWARGGHECDCHSPGAVKCELFELWWRVKLWTPHSQVAKKVRPLSTHGESHESVGVVPSFSRGKGESMQAWRLRWVRRMYN